MADHTHPQLHADRGLVDPTTKYPQPPFEKQSQEWPGLASRMNPRPDHGEQSYVGSGRLLGRKALITGADSGIGRAAAIAYAREGADVVLSYFPTEEPDAKEVVDLIHEAGRKAASLPGDLRDEAYCTKLVADAVAALGGIDILVLNAALQQAAARANLERGPSLPSDRIKRASLRRRPWRHCRGRRGSSRGPCAPRRSSHHIA